MTGNPDESISPQEINLDNLALEALEIFRIVDDHTFINRDGETIRNTYDSYHVALDVGNAVIEREGIQPLELAERLLAEAGISLSELGGAGNYTINNHETINDLLMHIIETLIDQRMHELEPGIDKIFEEKDERVVASYGGIDQYNKATLR